MEEEIKTLRERLDRDGKTDQIRLDIADLMLKCLYEKRDTLGYWEKDQLATACRNLKMNWLELSLLNIQNALAPPDDRDENYTLRDKEIDSLTYEQLVAEIRRFGGHGCLPGNSAK